MPRVTADLTPDLHHELRDWLTHAARELSLTRVTWQDVASILVEKLTTDSTLSASVLEAVRADRVGETGGDR